MIKCSGLKIHRQLLDMLLAQIDMLEKLANFDGVEGSKQGQAQTRPAMTIIVQQAYYNGRGPTTQKVKINVWSCST